MLPKRLRAAVVDLQSIDLPVAGNVHDTQHVGSSLQRRSDEASAQAVAGERSRVETNSFCMRLHDVGDAAIRKPLGRDRLAASPDWPENRSLGDAGALKPILERSDGDEGATP